jgi:hypothetical protein
MEMVERIKKLVEVFKVANDHVIGNVAAEIYNLNWKKEGLSRRNNAHKYLDELALTNQIKKGKGFYSIKEYQGEYKLGGHDRRITETTAQLICLKLPITIYREVSFPIGIRSDLVILIGKGNKAICAVIEVANNETPEYLNQKIIAWKNWTEAPQDLSNLFSTNIPHFSIITEGITHPLAVEFTKFIEEVSYGNSSKNIE